MNKNGWNDLSRAPLCQRVVPPFANDEDSRILHSAQILGSVVAAGKMICFVPRKLILCEPTMLQMILASERDWKTDSVHHIWLQAASCCSV